MQRKPHQLITYALAEKLEIDQDTRERIELNIANFLKAKRAQYEPTAETWLTFPHIACALGDKSSDCSTWACVRARRF
jgi:hypothetical protein